MAGIESEKSLKGRLENIVSDQMKEIREADHLRFVPTLSHCLLLL